jgi:hypothetical protein
MRVLAAIQLQNRQAFRSHCYSFCSKTLEMFWLHDHGRKTAYQFFHNTHMEFQAGALDVLS